MSRSSTCSTSPSLPPSLPPASIPVYQITYVSTNLPTFIPTFLSNCIPATFTMFFKYLLTDVHLRIYSHLYILTYLPSLGLSFSLSTVGNFFSLTPYYPSFLPLPPLFFHLSLTLSFFLYIHFIRYLSLLFSILFLYLLSFVPSCPPCTYLPTYVSNCLLIYLPIC